MPARVGCGGEWGGEQSSSRCIAPTCGARSMVRVLACRRWSTALHPQLYMLNMTLWCSATIHLYVLRYVSLLNELKSGQERCGTHAAIDAEAVLARGFLLLLLLARVPFTFSCIATVIAASTFGSHLDQILLRDSCCGPSLMFKYGMLVTCRYRLYVRAGSCCVAFWDV